MQVHSRIFTPIKLIKFNTIINSIKGMNSVGYNHIVGIFEKYFNINVILLKRSITILNDIKNIFNFVTS